MRRAAPVRVTLRRSWLAAAFVVSVHGSTAALLFALPLSVAPRATALVAVLLSALWSLHRALLPKTSAIVLYPDHRFRLVDTSGGEPREADVLASSLVMSGLVIIRYRVSGRSLSRSLLILPDMCGAEELRLLRVALRWRRGAKEISAP